MEENSDDGLVSHTDTSPLKTIQLDYQKPGCSKEYDGDSDSSDKIPSYQLPPKTEKEQAVEEEKQSDAKRKRKADAEVTSSAEAKIRKNGGIRKKNKETFGQEDVSQVNGSKARPVCEKPYWSSERNARSWRWNSEMKLGPRVLSA